MPWQKSYDENEVLEGAMRAFWQRGYQATSMQDLVTATGINRGSIYAAYVNKRGLFMRALEHYDRAYRAAHLAHLGTVHAPLDAIIVSFESAARQAHDRTTPPGCLLVNTALELSPHDPEIGQFVAQSLQSVEDFFHDRLAVAQQRGDLSAQCNCRETAQSLLGLFLGLRVLTRADASNEAVASIISQARKLLL